MLLVILMNVTSRLVYSSGQSAVWHGETQLYIINFFSKFVDAGDIRFAETVPRVRIWFLSGTRVAGLAMGNIRLLFNGNGESFQSKSTGQ
jgi:hypothetical protein